MNPRDKGRLRVAGAVKAWEPHAIAFTEEVSLNPYIGVLRIRDPRPRLREEWYATGPELPFWCRPVDSSAIHCHPLR